MDPKAARQEARAKALIQQGAPVQPDPHGIGILYVSPEDEFEREATLVAAFEEEERLREDGECGPWGMDWPEAGLFPCGIPW